MLDLRGIKSIHDPNDNSKSILTRTCPFCGKEHSVTVSTEALNHGLADVANGALVQDAFPSFGPNEREFLTTGICEKCWDSV